MLGEINHFCWNHNHTSHQKPTGATSSHLKQNFFAIHEARFPDTPDDGVRASGRAGQPGGVVGNPVVKVPT